MADIQYRDGIGVALLLALNTCFRKPVHPFNLEDEGKETFAEWEFAQSARLAWYYQPEVDLMAELGGHTVLDVGAGGGGKTTFYALNGARHVTGIDTQVGFINQARAFAASKGAQDVDFVVANAEHLPFADASFDVCVMNDVFEHLSKPEVVLTEVNRVLRSGGKVFINSPPYFHPYGAHLTDVIGIPYVHVLFPEPVLINAYKKLALRTASPEKRVSLRFGVVDGRERITYINHMTVARFQRITSSQLKFRTIVCKLVPLRKQGTFLLHTPLREYWTRMMVYVGEKV